MAMSTIVLAALLLANGAAIIGCNYAAATHEPRIDLTISARLRRLELSWHNVTDFANTTILLTTAELAPNESFVVRHHHDVAAPGFDNDKYYIENPTHLDLHHPQSPSTPPQPLPFATSTNAPIIVFALSLNQSSGWHTTTVPFDYQLSRNVTARTSCYGYWASLVGPTGERLAQTCIRAYPKWMNDRRTDIGAMRIRDLFLVGSHDSGSYRVAFDPVRNETRVSKYTLTQDDDIMGQLMHGVRYLDIRVGNYRKQNADSKQFWVNHGISRQHPLDEVLQQVRDFVGDTNEIVVFDVQEFPIGFTKLAKHRDLVYYLHSAIGDLMCHPELTWSATLVEIWRSGCNVIVSYDNRLIVEEFPDILFESVQQRWGNVQSLGDLKRSLSPAGRLFTINYARPTADMAEMTPTAWDVFSDHHSGLRQMADLTNREVSRWYSDEWSDVANVVAVDFVRGTNLMETSLLANAKRSAMIAEDSSN